MDKATELREDIRRTEQQLSEVFRQFFIRNGHMGIEVILLKVFSLVNVNRKLLEV